VSQWHTWVFGQIGNWLKICIYVKSCSYCEIKHFNPSNCLLLVIDFEDLSEKNKWYFRKKIVNNLEEKMSHAMTKPTYCVCDQHGSWSDCPFLQHVLSRTIQCECQFCSKQNNYCTSIWNLTRILRRLGFTQITASLVLLAICI
jgi:hypothetical protein